jgi:hypothetical protein
MKRAGPQQDTTIERYRRISSLREAGVTLQDIANQEGISRERVRQILDRGIPKPTGRPPMGGDRATSNRRLKMATTTIEAPIELREATISSAPATMKVESVLVPGRMAIRGIQWILGCRGSLGTSWKATTSI